MPLPTFVDFVVSTKPTFVDFVVSTKETLSRSIIVPLVGRVINVMSSRSLMLGWVGKTKTSGSLLQAALSLCRLKQTATCTLSLETRRTLSRESSSVKYPAESTWCEIRKTIFSWTRTRFPLHIRSTRELTINETPIITVIGKAFWDVGHAHKDQSNRRKRLPQYAAWEIHPVMALHVVQQVRQRQ